MAELDATGYGSNNDGFFTVSTVDYGSLLLVHLLEGSTALPTDPDNDVNTTHVSGTGLFEPFLGIQDQRGTEEGFNTDFNPIGSTTNPDGTSNDAKVSDNFTHAIKLSDLPIITIGGKSYYEIRLDLNEPGTATNPNAPIALSQFQIYLGGNGSPTSLAGLTKVFDIQGTVILNDSSSGSGSDDYGFYIPVETLQVGGGDPYLTLYAQFGPEPAASGGFEEFAYRFVPSIDLTKDVASVANPDGSQSTKVVNEAGDVVTYSITVKNTGNVDLQDVTVTDKVEGGATVTLFSATGGSGNPVTFQTGSLLTSTGLVSTGDLDHSGAVNGTEVWIAGDANGNNILDSGETWSLTTAYVVSQADIDNKGYTDSDIDNVAVVTAQGSNSNKPSFAVTDQDDASVGLIYNPSIQVTKTFVDVTDFVNDKITEVSSPADANEAGDKLNFTITVKNNGNVTLAAPVVTDINAPNVTADTVDFMGTLYNTGDTDHDGLLDVGETWNYKATHTLTQDEIDSNGSDATGALDTDGDVDNHVKATTTTAVLMDKTVEGEADASATIVRAPSIDLVKKFTGVTDNPNEVDITDPTHANGAGDKINYLLTATNTGNVTLLNPAVTDAFADTGSIAQKLGMDGKNVGDVNGDGELDVGETWSFTAVHTLTQAEINAHGNVDAAMDGTNDNLLRNTATVSASQKGGGKPVTDMDSASVPIDYVANFSIQKAVKTGVDTMGNAIFDNADSATGPTLTTGAPVDFRITIANTGNVSLTSVLVTDQNFSGSTPGAVKTLFAATEDDTAMNVTPNYQDGLLFGTVHTGDLNHDTLLGSGETWVAGDTNGNNILDVGETWKIDYTEAFDYGQHKNTATADTLETAAKSDDAYYTSLQPGPGVRTPGFWAGQNNGSLFWNGKIGDSKIGDNFADHDLLYVNKAGTGTDAKDPNHGYEQLVVGPDGRGGTVAGLLIGDYNLNGVRDGNEDTIFVSRDNALTLLNASQKDQGDGRYMLARDVVATWLNYLAGNPLDSGDNKTPFSNNPLSPKGYLDDAIDYLQKFALDADGNGLSPSDLKTGAIGTSTANWQTVRDYGAENATNHNTNSAGKSTDYTGAELHAALDHYNNDGNVAAGAPIYANDGDGSFFMAMMHTTIIV